MTSNGGKICTEAWVTESLEEQRLLNLSIWSTVLEVRLLFETIRM